MRYGILLFVGMLAFLCNSCGLHRSVNRVTDMREEGWYNLEKLFAGYAGTVQRNTSFVEEWKNSEIVWRKFDTAAKPDSAGRFPVSEEAVISKRDSAKQTAKEETESIVSVSDTINLTGGNHFEQFQELTKSTKTSTPFPWMLLLFIIVLFIEYKIYQYVKSKKNKAD